MKNLKQNLKNIFFKKSIIIFFKKSIIIFFKKYKIFLFILAIPLIAMITFDTKLFFADTTYVMNGISVSPNATNTAGSSFSYNYNYDYRSLYFQKITEINTFIGSKKINEYDEKYRIYLNKLKSYQEISKSSSGAGIGNQISGFSGLVNNYQIKLSEIKTSIDAISSPINPKSPVFKINQELYLYINKTSLLEVAQVDYDRKTINAFFEEKKVLINNAISNLNYLDSQINQSIISMEQNIKNSMESAVNNSFIESLVEKKGIILLNSKNLINSEDFLYYSNSYINSKEIIYSYLKNPINENYYLELSKNTIKDKDGNLVGKKLIEEVFNEIGNIIIEKYKLSNPQISYTAKTISFDGSGNIVLEAKSDPLAYLKTSINSDYLKKILLSSSKETIYENFFYKTPSLYLKNIIGDNATLKNNFIDYIGTLKVSLSQTDSGNQSTGTGSFSTFVNSFQTIGNLLSNQSYTNTIELIKLSFTKNEMVYVPRVSFGYKIDAIKSSLENDETFWTNYKTQGKTKSQIITLIKASPKVSQDQKNALDSISDSDFNFLKDSLDLSLGNKIVIEGFKKDFVNSGSTIIKSVSDISSTEISGEYIDSLSTKRQGLQEITNSINKTFEDINLINSIEDSIKNTGFVKGCEPGNFITIDGVRYAKPQKTGETATVPCSKAEFKEFSDKKKRELTSTLKKNFGIYAKKSDELFYKAVEESNKYTNAYINPDTGNTKCKPGTVMIGDGCVPIGSNVYGAGKSDSIGEVTFFQKDYCNAENSVRISQDGSLEGKVWTDSIGWIDLSGVQIGKPIENGGVLHGSAITGETCQN